MSPTMTVILDMESGQYAGQRMIIGGVTRIEDVYGYKQLDHDHEAIPRKFKLSDIERCEVVSVVKSDRGAL